MVTTGSTAALPPAADLRSHLALGRAARTQGDHAAALCHFAAAAAVAGPSNPWPRLDQATTLCALGRMTEADAGYAAVLADHPGQVEALLGLGRVARARGDDAAALLHFAAAASAAAVTGPGNPWPRLDLAATLCALGRMAEADAGYAAVLADHPGQVEALLGLGRVARARGDGAAALLHFAAAASAAALTGSANPWPRLEQAATLRGLGHAAEAAGCYAAVLADQPRNHHALIGLGLLARDRGDRVTAAARFRAATEAEPRANAGWIELATELREAGEYDVAQKIADRLITAAPGDLQAWMSLGRTERAAGRRPAALAAFRGAHACKPCNPYPLIEMASELRALDQPNAAQKLLLQALEADPASLQALEQLGELARLAGEHAIALARFGQATSLRPGSPWAYLGTSRTLADLGQRDAALAVLTEAERHCGCLPELAAGQIDLSRQLGDWPHALVRARETTAAMPRHFGLWVQRFRMENLLSSPAEVAACLDAAPTASRSDLARVHHFRGQAADEDWQTDEAVGHYERALALRPEDAWILSDLTRARILSLDIAAARGDLEQLVQLTAATAILQGRSSNLSQTHFGQILDEFTLDRQALAELTALRGVAPEARIVPLCQMLERFPDYTPAAMLLLIALRQTGRLTPDPTDAMRSGGAIPKRIIQYWDSAEVPPEIAVLMQSWRDRHPQHGYTRYDHVAAEAFLQEACPAATLAAYRRAREPAQKADIFRLAYLFAEGGIYIDADDRCLAPLGTVTSPQASLMLYQEDYGTVGNNVIGAVPQHPVIGLALELAVAAINRGDSDILWFSTGPGLLTRALARTLSGPHLALPVWLRSLHILPRREMHRAVAMHCQAGYKSTERHWSQTAFARRRKPAPAPQAQDAAIAA